MASAEVHEINKGAGRLPSLDGLRAVSILLVLAGTSMIWTKYQELGRHLLLRHARRADFFRHQRLLITRLLLAEEAKMGSISLKAFFARRALRILPVQFAYLGY